MLVWNRIWGIRQCSNMGTIRLLKAELLVTLPLYNRACLLFGGFGRKGPVGAEVLRVC